MSTAHTEARAEERAAREQERHMQRMARGHARVNEAARRERIKGILARFPRGTCRCPLRPSITNAELRSLGAGCTGPMYVCPRLDAVRRGVGS